MLEVAEVPEDDIINARCRYQGSLQEYNRFSKAMNLPVQRDRIYVDGWGNIGVGKTKNAVDKSAESGIIDEKLRKSSNPRDKLRFISDEQFDNLTIEARKNGANILRGSDEIEKHLDDVGASAAIVGDTLLFRKDVCISDVLEETHHYMQNIQNLNSDKSEPLRTILNEIEAKKYLLENSKKYKIPRNEIETTKKHLESYEEELIKYVKEFGTYE